MKKFVVVLFGFLVVIVGFVVVIQWRVILVYQRYVGRYGWVYVEVYVKYDLQYLYINYKIIYRIGRGGFISVGWSVGYIFYYYNIFDRDGIEFVINVVDFMMDNFVEQDIVFVGWLCI